MSLPDDPELRQSFVDLRRQELREGPAFAPLWEAAGRRRRERRERTSRPFLLAGAGAAVAVLALLAVWLVRPQVPEPPPSAWAAPSISAWRAPTDFLLRTPGREILRETPALGRGFPIGLGSPSNPVSRERRPS